MSVIPNHDIDKVVDDNISLVKNDTESHLTVQELQAALAESNKKVQQLQNQLDAQEHKETKQIVNFLKSHGFSIDEKDPVIYSTLYIEHILKTALKLDYSDFFVEFDKRMQVAREFVDAAEQQKQLLTTTLASEHSEQRKTTVAAMKDELNTHISKAVNNISETFQQLTPKLEERLAEVTRQRKTQELITYAILILSIINILV